MNQKGERFYCPCCGFRTLPEKPPGTYNICEICYWEDDPIQFENPTYEGGANNVSLIQAKKNFEKYGACEKRLIKYTRSPKNTDVRRNLPKNK